MLSLFNLPALDVDVDPGNNPLQTLMSQPWFYTAVAAIILAMCIAALWRRPKVLMLVVVVAMIVLWAVRRGIVE